jgi:6-phosphogluconolactonase
MTTKTFFKNLLVITLISVVISCKSMMQHKSESASNQESMQKSGNLILFVGTYTEKESWVNGKADGISEYKMDMNTGRLTFVCKSPRTINPSYLAIHPGKNFLYAVNETGGTSQNPTGTVSAFHIDTANNRLDFVSSVSSQGLSPCFISFDKFAKFVLVANYGSGTVAMLPVDEKCILHEAVSADKHAGKGPTSRQEAPHAHMIIPSPYKNFVYSVDLGIDQILLYVLDGAARKLIPTGRNTLTSAGAGPRQMVFHPLKPWSYVVCELNGTIEAYRVDTSSGSLSIFQTISNHGGTTGENPASGDIHITPSGKYLYASNRGNVNNIAMFSINQESGELSLIGYQSTFGKTPRNFVIDPTGMYLLVANQDSDTIVTFKIDPETGKLIETGIVTQSPTPACLKFL